MKNRFYFITLLSLFFSALLVFNMHTGLMTLRLENYYYGFFVGLIIIALTVGLFGKWKLYNAADRVFKKTQKAFLFTKKYDQLIRIKQIMLAVFFFFFGLFFFLYSYPEIQTVAYPLIAICLGMIVEIIVFLKPKNRFKVMLTDKQVIIEDSSVITIGLKNVKKLEYQNHTLFFYYPNKMMELFDVDALKPEDQNSFKTQLLELCKAHNIYLSPKVEDQLKTS